MVVVDGRGGSAEGRVMVVVGDVMKLEFRIFSVFCIGFLSIFDGWREGESGG